MTLRGNIHWLILCSLCLVLATSGPALAAKKKRGNNKRNSATISAIRQGIAVRKQIAAEAQRRLDAAVRRGNIAQSALDVIASNADAAVQQARAAKTNSNTESRNVNAIEGDILALLPANAPYRQAEERYFDALEQFERARNRVLNSDEYKREYEFARRGPDSNERLTALRKESLDGNEDVVRTRRAMLAAKDLLAEELAKLVLDDDAWKNAVAVSKQARVEEAKAKIDVRSAMIHRLGATSSRNEALKDATAAQQTLSKARSDIARLEAALSNMQRSNSRNSRNGRTASSSRKK